MSAGRWDSSAETIILGTLCRRIGAVGWSDTDV